MAIRILFDDKELSSQAIMSLSQSGQLFDSTFKLGSTLCRSVKLEVNSRYVSLPRPNVVYIYDDDVIKFTLYIDNVEKVDDFTYSYTLCDSMVKLNVALSDVFDWDTSTSYTVQTIVDNICDYIGSSHVTVDYIGDLSVSWDWDTMARDFLSYVAEINASYVYINASGNVTFVEHKNAPSHTLDVETCEDISIGEYHCIQRVGYEQASASIYYPTTEVDYNTVYINQDNVLITDSGDFTREGIIQHIYEKINGFEFYCMSTSKCEIYQDCIAGDIINTSVINDKFLATAKGQILANTLGQKLIARIKTSIPTIAQIDWSYNAKWNGGYDLDIDTDVQEETQIVSSTEKKIKSLKITVDRELGLIKQEVSDVNEKVDDVNTELTTKYSTTEQTSEMISSQVSEMKSTIEGDVSSTLRNYSTLQQTSNAISAAVSSEVSRADNKYATSSDVANTYATKASLSIYVKEEDAPSKVASWIEASADNIIIKYSNSLIFGDYPNGQYMQARTNDSNNGVLFKGTGTFELDSVGDFNLINYADSNYSTIKNRIYTYTNDNYPALELRNYFDGNLANFVRLYSYTNTYISEMTKSLYLFNISNNGSNAGNLLQLNSNYAFSSYHTSTNYAYLMNACFNDPTKVSNSIRQVSSATGWSGTYIANYDLGVIANQLYMQSTNAQNQITLTNNSLDSTTISNQIIMQSFASSYVHIFNYQPSTGTSKNELYLDWISGNYSQSTLINKQFNSTNNANILQMYSNASGNLLFLGNYELGTGNIMSRLNMSTDYGLQLANQSSILKFELSQNVTLQTKYSVNIISTDWYVVIKSYGTGKRCVWKQISINGTSYWLMTGEQTG